MKPGRSQTAQLSYWQRRVYIVAWVTYASYYLTRLNLSTALPGLANDFGYSKLALGLIGSGFSFIYALGQVVNGWWVGRVGSRRLVAFGLLTSSLVNLFFGFTDLLIVMIILWALNGYAQSTGWPAMVKVLAEWFPAGRRGRVTGLFGACFLVGGIVSWLLAGFLAGHYGWRLTFWVPSITLLLPALLFYVGVRDTPEGIGLSLTDREMTVPRHQAHRKPGFWKIGVVAAAFTCLNFVRSGFTLWAPTYVLETRNVSLDIAVYVASIIPAGGVLGALVAGWATDRLFASRRAPVAVIMMTLLSLLLPVFYLAPSIEWLQSLLLLATAGFLLYGPHVLMATTMPIDYASKHGAATAAGIIDGIAYLGVALADPFTGWLVDIRGWDAAVAFWITSTVAATVLMLALWRDQPVAVH